MNCERERNVLNMALTRKFLKALGIEEDKIEEIIIAHAESVDGIKAKYTDYDDIKSALDDITKERDTLKSRVDTDDSSEIIEKLKKQIKEYADKEQLSVKTSLVKELIKKAGIDEKRVDTILRVTDLDKLTVKDGAVVDSETFVENIKSEYPEFIAKVGNEPHIPNTPPEGSNAGIITKEKFNAMSYNERLNLYNSDKEAYDKLVKEG